MATVKLLRLVLLGLSLFLWLPLLTSANGGTVQYEKTVGKFKVTAITSPTPPQPDSPMHLTFIVIDAEQEKQGQIAFVSNAQVDVTVRQMAAGGTVKGPFIAGPSQVNIQSYDLNVPVQGEGPYEVGFTVRAPGLGDASDTFQIQVVSINQSPWTALLVPLAVVAVGAIGWLLFGRDRRQMTPEEQAAYAALEQNEAEPTEAKEKSAES